MVTGVVAAPAISSCAQNADQPFLSCVVSTVFNRDDESSKVSNASDPAKTEVAQTEVAPEQTDAPAVVEEAEKAPAVEPDPIVPDFTIARAAADGLVVIVGTADAKDTVIVKADGKILGKTKPESNGEWVFVPENPLATGGVEITVEAQDAKGNFTQAAKSEIVLIHPGRDQEPIVVASVPGQASDIIQGLEPKTVEVAQAPVESTPEVAESEPEPVTPTDSNDSQNAQVAAVVEETVEPEIVAEEATPKVAEADPVEPTPMVETPEATETADPVETVVEETADAVEQPAQTADEQVADTAPTEQVQEAEIAQVPEAAPTPAMEAEPTAQEVETAQAAQVAIEAIENFVQPTIDAIEIDGTMNFIAGAGPDGATMRIYVDNQYVADAVVADGRWLVETQNVLTKQSQRVRADMLVADTSQVTARTEVNFVVENFVEVPEPIADAPVVAQETTPVEAPVAPTTEQASVETAPSVQETAQTETVAPTPEPATTPEPMQTAEAAVEDMATPEAPAETEEPAAPVVQSQPAAANEAVEPAIEDTQATTIVEEPVDATKVEDAAQAAPETPVDTITAVAVGDGEEQRFVSGKAIIRKGDNLWTIARRVYGSGVKYTTIYEANANDISNPNMIFPGQVFDLPNQE